MRILHFSDLHLGLGPGRIPLGDWFGKRLAGGLNLLRGRGRHFTEAAHKARALVRLDGQLAPDLVVCSGDLTALSTHAEFEAARDLLGPLPGSPRFVVTPGNHDVYTRATVREGRFERYFPESLESGVPGLRTDGPWPLVRLPDDHVAVVAVNSARPNLLPWVSSGRVPDAQLRGLEAALTDPRLQGRFVFLVTHYAPCRADGSPDRRHHGLRNVDALLRAARGIDRGALLCGHVHRLFRRRIDDFAGEVFCAGSATFAGREGVWVFDRDDRGLWTARRGTWTGEDYDVEATGRPVAGQAEGGEPPAGAA